jgi:2-desacetyl-2-hydroxyethyl bacteriochlorophyllide A dehydrogenase
MKAAIFYSPDRPLNIEEVEKPKIAPTEVLVAVKVCGICHTDVAMIRGIYPPRKKPPFILGHEISGEVVEVGSEVKRIKIGDRVVVQASISCGNCYFCLIGRDNICAETETIGIDRDGGYAEYVSVPERNVFKLPQQISYEEGAVISDALSTPYHAIETAQLEMNDTVVIFGMGGLGLNAVQVATKLRGANVIAVDIVDSKLKLAQDFGAYQIVNASKEDPVEKVRKITKGFGANCALEFIGLPITYVQAVKSVKRGGKVVMVGASTKDFSIAPFRLFKEELKITGSYTAIKSDFPILIDLVKEGKLNVKGIVTHTVSLDNINHGVEIMEKKIENLVRVAVKF